MSVGECVSLVSVLIAFLSLIFVVKNWKRTDKKDAEERAQELAEKAKESAIMNIKLDNITSTVNDIKYDISATKREIAELTTRVNEDEKRLVEVGESTKSAHKRIDGVEERISK